jgi:hypothetical protein
MYFCEIRIPEKGKRGDSYCVNTKCDVYQETKKWIASEIYKEHKRFLKRIRNKKIKQVSTLNEMRKKKVKWLSKELK